MQSFAREREPGCPLEKLELGRAGRWVRKQALPGRKATQGVCCNTAGLQKDAFLECRFSVAGFGKQHTVGREGSFVVREEHDQGKLGGAKSRRLMEKGT